MGAEAKGKTMDTMTKAAADVLAERLRQVEAEGWTPEHDDTHTDEELAEAAACYALPTPNYKRAAGLWVPSKWPWPASWWKPKDRRRNLVRAAALVLAEIERLDRADALAADVASRHAAAAPWIA